MDVYIGNLPYTFGEDQLRELLQPFGATSSVRIMTDRETGRSRGFAFASFADDNEARTAIAELNGREIDGRRLVVNEAQPRGGRGGGARGQGYGGGGDRGGYGGGRGGYGGGGGGGRGGGRGGYGGFGGGRDEGGFGGGRRRS